MEDAKEIFEFSFSTLVPVTDIINDVSLLSPFSTEVAIMISIIIGVVILLTIVGNLLVIVAFLTTPRLRVYNNYFILGLAIADFLIGAVTMPNFAVVIITGRWPFGVIFCDVITFLDHSFSHTSILLVTLISLDRCVAVSYPLRHRHHWRRRSRAILIIAIGYIVPIVIWLPLTALWEVIHGINKRPIPLDVCDPLYFGSFFASMAVSFIFFFIPLTLIAIFCTRIYIAIRNFYRGRKKMKVKFEKSQMSGAQKEARDSGPSDAARTILDAIQCDVRKGEGKIEINMTKGDHHTAENKDEARKDSMKGVRTLVLIVVAMAIAWFPAVLIGLISAICPVCLIPSGIYSSAVFWGYINSLMNPICYALADKAFKDSFVRLLSPS